MKRDYNKLINSGTTAQIEKLKENEHKKGFDNIDVYYAFKRIIEETEELKNELYQFCFKKKNIDYNKARREAADIANFAHMIIYFCDRMMK